MAVNLSPVGGVAAQFFTNSGAVLTGGKLYTYLAGTTTPATTYTSSNGSTVWTNPIVLDAAGRVPSGGEIWLTDGLSYKFILKDSNDVLIATYDNISGINSNFVAFVSQQEIVTATAGQTVFNLGISYQPGTNSLSVFVDGVNQYGSGAQYAYVETDGNTVTFNSGLHVGAEVKFTTTQQQSAGAVDASQVSYTAPFVDSVPTNVEDKLAQYVSVKDFGAVGDGIVDDTDAIQAALTASVAVYLPEGEYKTTRPLILRKDQSLRGAGVSASIVKKYGTSVIAGLVGNGRGYTQNLNVNAVFIAVEANYPYDANGVVLSNFGISSDATQATNAPFGILAFRLVNSVIENIDMTNVFNGIEGQTIDYAAINVTQTGTGNALDSFLLKVSNVVVRPFNVGISVGTTSTLVERCYTNGGVVGYKISGNYMSLLNCACDGASDISYWNQGITTFTGCGQEAATGNQLRDELSAFVDGWTVTNPDTLTLITAYNTASWSATRTLTAGDAAYRAIFSPGKTVFKNVVMLYTKGFISTAGNPFKNKALDFDNVIFYSASDNPIKVPAKFYTTGTDTIDWQTGYTVYANTTDNDPWNRAVDYPNNTYPSVGTYSILDQGSMYLFQASIDLSGLGASTKPVRLVLEVPDANFILGLNFKLKFNPANPFAVNGFPNWTQIPAAASYPSLGAGVRGSRWRTINFITRGGSLTFDYVGGYEPADGCIYLFKQSTGAQMNFNDSGIATTWQITGWLPKIML